MKKSSPWVVVAAIALTSSAVQAQSTDRQGERPERQSANPITLKGCLQGSGAPGTPGAGNGGNTSTRAGGSAGDRFTLISASGSSAYTLHGKADELRKHVNQQVEVSGRISNDAGTSNSRDGARETAGDSGEAVGRSPTRDRIQVESVRMLAESCSK
jgi:hypothetical protein